MGIVEENPATGIAHPVGDIMDDNFGLAVATAIAPDDEPDYVYNAIEFDPEAKPPLHKNRRFRVYTYFALVLIASEFVMMCTILNSASICSFIYV